MTRSREARTWTAWKQEAGMVCGISGSFFCTVTNLWMKLALRRQIPNLTAVCEERAPDIMIMVIGEWNQRRLLFGD
jgi:hypothetical protein